MPEAIYLHIPFCRQKCRYCDFLSLGRQSEERMAVYLRALAAEVALVGAELAAKPRTLFIGGGTPSVVDESLLTPLLRAVEAWFVSPELEEYTIEANPESLTADKLALYRRFGVNRLSLGVQSAAAKDLALLGRAHSFEQAAACVKMARQAGFDNISLDLMYGLPEQTLADWQGCLEQILTLAPDHLSLYQLKIEENTLFHRWLREGRLQEFDDEVAWQMYQYGRQRLEAAGFHQYEISNYARPGFESEHNKVYWRTADYLGLGLGAHSFISPVRYCNPAQWQAYTTPLLAGQRPWRDSEGLTRRQCMEETIFMGLRMNAGVSRAEFIRRYGVPLETVFADAMAKCTANGWLEMTDERLRLTDQGRVLGNLVFVEFIE